MKDEIKFGIIVALLACTLAVSVIIGATLHVKEETGTSLDDCPCPERDSDPTGGSLSPIEALQYLEMNFSRYINFTEIVEEYGQVTGSKSNRTALLNITITNNKETEEEATISLKNKAISWHHDRLFMEATISIQDQDRGITYYLYTHRSWKEDNWYCSTYDFNDYTFTIPPNSNKTIILHYTLDCQPSGAFIDGQIFSSPYEVFGIYLGENNKRWQYFPFEVRT